MFNDDSEVIAICPACGTEISYCQGHGSIGDPTGFAILSAHDDGHHERCHPASECQPQDEPRQHIHTYVTSTDCDGQIDRSWVTYPDDPEATYAMSELIEAAVGQALPLYDNQRIEITVVPIQDEDTGGDSGYQRITIHHQTDEGFRSTEIVSCGDDCDDDPTYRDHTAEAAGY